MRINEWLCEERKIKHLNIGIIDHKIKKDEKIKLLSCALIYNCACTKMIVMTYSENLRDIRNEYFSMKIYFTSGFDYHMNESTLRGLVNVAIRPRREECVRSSLEFTTGNDKLLLQTHEACSENFFFELSTRPVHSTGIHVKNVMARREFYSIIVNEFNTLL